MQASFSSITMVPTSIFSNTISNLVIYLTINKLCVFRVLFHISCFLQFIFKFTGLIDTLKACCGAGPKFPYNYNSELFCDVGSSVCSNPNTYLNWDGFHFTHAFNLQVFRISILKGLYLNPFNVFKFCHNT